MEDCYCNGSYQLRSGYNECAYEKILDDGVSRLIILMYRQAISAVSLAPIAYFWERPKLTAGVLCQLFLSALIGATLCLYSFLLGLQYTSSTFTCAFVNMVPAITFMLALPFGNKAGATKVIGTLVCIGGAMVLTLYKGKTLVGSDSGAAFHAENYADMMVSSKNTTERWAIGSCNSISHPKFDNREGLHQMDLERKTRTRNSGLHRTGMVGSGLCYAGLSWCVKQKGPVFTSPFTPLVQIFVAIFDFSILHGQIYFGRFASYFNPAFLIFIVVHQRFYMDMASNVRLSAMNSIIGSILVVIGLYILLWGRNREAEQTQQLKQTQIEEDSNAGAQV
ncbi:Ribosomal RNA processing Brix domain protein isoform 1 [Hibiscus syriacus]|uniref:WAT1-related protein n=1 Tax=Hibiscus syriacus TaxID=106335 RepID=A0A6A3C4C7_HIBSY|nr:Ribosomal RNA processing Brix domain protein isoform 1 [Hibiscus syriacus]